MQTEDSQQITARFFEALYALKAKGVIRGKLTFTKRYGINRWNLNALEKNQSTQNTVNWLGLFILSVTTKFRQTGCSPGAAPCSVKSGRHNVYQA